MKKKKKKEKTKNNKIQKKFEHKTVSPSKQPKCRIHLCCIHMTNVAKV